LVLVEQVAQVVPLVPQQLVQMAITPHFLVILQLVVVVVRANKLLRTTVVRAVVLVVMVQQLVVLELQGKVIMVAV